MFALFALTISCTGKITDETEGTDNRHDDTGIGPNPDTGGWTCSPLLNNQMAEMDIDIFDKAMEVEASGCYLERIDFDENGDGQVDSSESIDLPTELDCDEDNNCWQTLPSFAWSWSQTSEYGYDLPHSYDDIYEGRVDGQRRIQDGVETILLNLTAKPSGSTAERRVEREYNSLGQLLAETYFFNGDRWFEVTNTWDDDCLIEQNFLDYINTNGQSVNLTWSYDEDNRLLSSRYAQGSEAVNQAQFSYDDNGNLSMLTRSVDDVNWLTQTWTYEGDSLTSRNNVFLPNYQWQTAADTLMVESVIDYMSHWDQSMTKAIGDVNLPPHSLFHGYPDAEVVYQLGWSKVDIPNQVGFAYGYDGYGWRYGDLSWFGHSGIASSYGTEGAQDNQLLDVTITYESGRMVSEVIDITPPTDQNGVTVSIVRNRDFQNNQIRTDEIITTDNAETPHIQKNVLSFGYNATGQISQRDLSTNESLLHRSTWAYDSDGHLIEHGIFGNGSIFNVPSDPTSPNDLPHLSSYQQTTTQDSNGYERIREQISGQQTAWVYVDSLKRGSHERGEYEARDNTFVVHDEDGNLVITGGGNIDSPDYYNARFLDENGLLSGWEYAAANSVSSRTYVHTCNE